MKKLITIFLLLSSLMVKGQNKPIKSINYGGYPISGVGKLNTVQGNDLPPAPMNPETLNIYLQENITSTKMGLTFEAAKFVSTNYSSITVYSEDKLAMRVSQIDTACLIKVYINRKEITWINDSTFTIKMSLKP